MPLKLNTASSGSVTLDAANTASNFTITVPATTGTMALTSNIPASYTNADVLTLFSASGSAPVYACRAWVNFNGTGTVAIRASGNVSSVTDNGTGLYTLNFTTAMPDENYANVYGGCEDLTSASVGYFVGTFTQSGVLQIKSTTQLQICMKNQQGTAADATDISVSIFR